MKIYLKAFLCHDCCLKLDLLSDDEKKFKRIYLKKKRKLKKQLDLRNLMRIYKVHEEAMEEETSDEDSSD